MKKRLLISFLLVAVLSFTVVSSVSAVNEPPVADPNGPYTVQCQGTTTEVTLDGRGSYDPDGDPLTYLWVSDCPSATFNDDTSVSPTLIVDASSLLSCTVTLTVTDDYGEVAVAETSVEFTDIIPPVIDCNAPGTINPTDAPISFTATATDNCDSDPSVVITGYESYKFTKKGKVIDKSESTVIELDGDTITILDTGGVDTIIRWTVSATDSSGNEVETTCEVHVVIPGRP